jgi:hypothetical protein
MTAFASLDDAFWLIADHRELTVAHVPFVSRKCESCDRDRRNDGTISKNILEPSTERLQGTGTQRLKADDRNRCKGVGAPYLYTGNMRNHPDELDHHWCPTNSGTGEFEHSQASAESDRALNFSAIRE